jgi:hypothetical protein
VEPERTKKMIAMYEAWAKEIGVRPWPMPETPPGAREGKMLTPAYLRE